MPPALVFSLVAIVLLFGAQVFLRPIAFSRVARIVFWVLVSGNALLPFYIVYSQYQLWLAHPLSRFLLPPYQSINYFASYSAVNFLFMPILLSAMAGSAFLIMAILNKRSSGRLFEEAEPYLAGAAILLVGHPGWLYYLATVLLAALLLTTHYLLLSRNSEKLASLYYFWLPAALSVILISKLISLVASY